MPNSKTMTDKTQTQSSPLDAEAFTKLWQEKWAQMMKEKGWPESIAMPQMGQMPFFTPFMPGFPGFGTSSDSTLQAQVTVLEQRIATLEKKMAQRSKTPVGKAARKT